MNNRPNNKERTPTSFSGGVIALGFCGALLLLSTSANAVGTADGYVPVGTTSSTSMLGVFGGLSVGTSFTGTAAPTNGAIFQGNVGIGTNNPSQLLQLSYSGGGGQVLMAFGESHFGNNTYTDPASGFQYDAKFGGPNKGIAVKGNSLFSGNLGIGTTGTNVFTIDKPAITAATPSTYHTALNVAGLSYLTEGVDGTYAYIQSWNSKPLYINNQGNNVLIGAGNLGIGSTSPGYTLDVNGTIRVQGAGLYNSAGYRVFEGNASDWLRINPDSSWPNGVAAYGNWSFGSGGVTIGSWTDTSAGNLYVTNIIGIGELPSGAANYALETAGAINGQFPRWTLWIDTTSNARTSPGTFTKSYRGTWPTGGDFHYYTNNAVLPSILLEMKIYNTSASSQTVTQYVSDVDDNVYFYINNGGTVSPASVTGSGVKTQAVTWTFPALTTCTVNIVWNNSGAGGEELEITGDFFWQNTNLRFIGE